MAMAHPRDMRPPHDRLIQKRRRSSTLPLIAAVGFFILAVGFVVSVLWPRWPSEPVSIDAPSVPITVAGTTFNLPPAAIRVAMQRKPGTQERVDLAFLWPSLKPAEAKVDPGPSPFAIDRVFLTITASDGTLPPLERLKTIYPRYLETSISTGPGGLAQRPFRDGTPYQGEDLFYDSQAAEGFLVRCTRKGVASTAGTCLYERRIGAADVVARFPRDWLTDWPAVESGLQQLIASLRASAR